LLFAPFVRSMWGICAWWKVGLMRPEERLGSLLAKKGLTLSVAESCTGGLLGARITDVPGSSATFRGGVIAYQNEVKERLLRVPTRLLEGGGVSEGVARAMARGCRELLSTDVGVSITGIAGPGGGTRETPVGLVFVAVDSAWGDRSERIAGSGDRAANREEAVRLALEMAIALVEER